LVSVFVVEVVLDMAVSVDMAEPVVSVEVIAEPVVDVVLVELIDVSVVDIVPVVPVAAVSVAEVVDEVADVSVEAVSEVAFSSFLQPTAKIATAKRAIRVM
jgi:hypothetical protein